MCKEAIRRLNESALAKPLKIAYALLLRAMNRLLPEHTKIFPNQIQFMFEHCKLNFHLTL